MSEIKRWREKNARRECKRVGEREWERRREDGRKEGENERGVATLKLNPNKIINNALVHMLVTKI